MQAKNPGGGTLLNVANQLVPGIVEACEKYSVLDQRLRLELIEFHSVAEVVIPLSAIDAFSDNIPQLVAKGGTNFAAVFWKIFDEMGNGSLFSCWGNGVGLVLVEHYFSYHVNCLDGCGLGEPARGR